MENNKCSSKTTLIYITGRQSLSPTAVQLLGPSISFANSSDKASQHEENKAASYRCTLTRRKIKVLSKSNMLMMQAFLSLTSGFMSTEQNLESCK